MHEIHPMSNRQNARQQLQHGHFDALSIKDIRRQGKTKRGEPMRGARSWVKALKKGTTKYWRQKFALETTRAGIEALETPVEMAYHYHWEDYVGPDPYFEDDGPDPFIELLRVEAQQDTLVHELYMLDPDLAEKANVKVEKLPVLDDLELAERVKRLVLSFLMES